MAKLVIAFGKSMMDYAIKIKKVIPPIYRYFVTSIEDKDKVVLVFKKSFNDTLYKALLNKLPVILNNKYNYFTYKTGDKHNFVIATNKPEVISDSDVRSFEEAIETGDIF